MERRPAGPGEVTAEDTHARGRGIIGFLSQCARCLIAAYRLIYCREDFVRMSHVEEATSEALAPLAICHVRVTEDVLSVQRLCDIVGHEGAGAISTFLGTTRDNFDGKTVTRLEYEGYNPMAEQELTRVCNQAAARWELIGVAVEHRVGVVPVKESSVIIAVSSAHRTEAIKACEYIINELKATVPIWKKEFYEGEDSAWKENKEWRESRQRALQQQREQAARAGN